MGASAVAKGLARTVRALHRAEDALLVLLLSALIALGALQIVLRYGFDAGLSWADPLMRALVLWLGLLGALAASRERRHITIDVVSRLLPARTRALADAATSLFAAVVCALVAFHAVRFVASELRFGSVAFAGIPAWALEAVIPFAFAAMALRSLALFATRLATGLERKPPS